MATRPRGHSPAPLDLESILTKNRLIVSTVFCAALIVRLAYLMIAHRIGISPIVGDSPGYIDIAARLAAGNGFQAADGSPTAWRVPVYPLLLAAIFAVLGPNYDVLGIVQAVLGALTAGLVAAIAWRLAGPISGWFAGLTVAFYPHLITWTPYVLSEIPFIFFAMLALWLLVEGQSQGSRWWFAWAGLALVLGTLTRTMLLAFIPVAAAMAWWLASARDRWMRAGLVVLAPIVLISLWMIRNALVVGSLTLSTQGPVSIWWGHNPDLATYHSGGYAEEPPPPQPVPAHVSETELSELYWQGLRAYLSAEPLSVVQDMPVRLWNMWRPWYGGSSVRGLLAFGGSYLVVLALGLAGFMLTLRSPPHQGVRYVQSYVISIALFHAIVIGEIRLRMPIEPALAIFAGIAIAHLVSLLHPSLEASTLLPQSKTKRSTPVSSSGGYL